MRQLISELANQIRERERFTAVGIAVGHKDNLIESAVSGVRRHKSTVPVELADKWHIGSITKSITATVLGRLVDSGTLKFDSAISDLLPDISIHPLWEECSLEHLLTHTSGLPANFPMKSQKIDPKTTRELVLARRDLIQEILTKPPKTPSGSAFLYSNLGYAIIGHIIETQTDSCYEEWVREQLFEPLGLDSAGFGPPLGLGPDDQPMGHYSVLWCRKPANPFEGRADNGPIISAAGRAHMNLHDIVTYGRRHLDGELGVDPFLNSDTWKKVHKPIMNDYAYGWVNTVRDWAGGPVIWHNGSNMIWYALLMLLPKKNAVLAFVTNNGAIRKAEKAFIQAAKQICGVGCL
ncbi:MAG: serine hydrolase domain-containing protein [Cyanobacteria bacterium P01_F01_bin.150]